MQVEYCEFPDDLLYDIENNVWVRKERDGRLLLGITSVHAALAGVLSKVEIKPAGSLVAKMQNLATIESLRYFGAVKTPLSCRVITINEALLLKPKLANDYPYSDGWFVRLEPTSLDREIQGLSSPIEAEDTIRSMIHNLHIRCFKAYPDYELWEIGVECAAVLIRLSELIKRCAIGEVVHVVSDDPTADIEMVRWSDQSGQALLESRSEGNLTHFIVRKVRE